MSDRKALAREISLTDHTHWDQERAEVAPDREWREAHREGNAETAGASAGVPMKEYIFLSENGSDKNSGLESTLPVRSPLLAVQLSIKTRRQIYVLGGQDAVARLGKEVEDARRAKK
jgi:hypothetical protein